MIADTPRPSAFFRKQKVLPAFLVLAVLPSVELRRKFDLDFGIVDSDLTSPLRRRPGIDFGSE
jgi:hypothetical protein